MAVCLTVPAQCLGVFHLKTLCHCNPFSQAIVGLKMSQSSLRCSLVLLSGTNRQLLSSHLSPIMSIFLFGIDNVDLMFLPFPLLAFHFPYFLLLYVDITFSLSDF